MSAVARIIEVFSSIQGEGIYVGQPHLFVRFWDCNLTCHYCDTDYRGPYQEYTRQRLLEAVENRVHAEGPHQAVSLTGGEPLLWWRFLKEWLPGVKELDQRTYLETNGTLPQPLSEVLPWVDIIAMDIKPPSSTQDQEVWKSHEEFLRVAVGKQQNGERDHPELFVKIVVTRETSDEEMEKAFDLMGRAAPGIPLVLQPVTPWGPVQEKPLEEQLNRWRRKANRRLSDVRIIPQMHRLLGVR
ncbi:MAG: 7-carboxy-7-deazaguanine synthase QueE [Candidatus Omnitrophica bacterium]|nr:7-carboxy-7-deazaguanine synthase QueE [Candidatus Omnitrophota bacterium]